MDDTSLRTDINDISLVPYAPVPLLYSSMADSLRKRW